MSTLCIMGHGTGANGDPLVREAEVGRLDALFNGPRGDGLAYGPVERFDEPGVTGQPDLLGSCVDLLGEFVGDAEGYGFCHIKNASTIASDIKSAIILGMHTTVAQNIAHRTDAAWIKTAKRVTVNGENYISEYRNVFTGQAIRKDWRMTGNDWVIFDADNNIVTRAHSLTWAKLDAEKAA